MEGFHRCPNILLRWHLTAAGAERASLQIINTVSYTTRDIR